MRAGMVGDEAEIHRRADADEKQPEEQTFERFEIAFEFMAVRAAGEHHTTEKRAESGRETDHRHQPANRQDEQQRGRGEDFAQAGAGDPAEEQRQQPASGQHHSGDRGRHRQPAHPGRGVGERARRVVRLVWRRSPRAAAARRASG